MHCFNHTMALYIGRTSIVFSGVQQRNFACILAFLFGLNVLMWFVRAEMPVNFMHLVFISWYGWRYVLNRQLLPFVVMNVISVCHQNIIHFKLLMVTNVNVLVICSQTIIYVISTLQESTSVLTFEKRYKLIIVLLGDTHHFKPVFS